MKKRLTPEEKQELVARYQMGEPVKSLRKEEKRNKNKKEVITDGEEE